MGYKVTLGAVPSPVDIRDWKIKAPQAVNYPDSCILTNLPDVLNQGSVGSCVAHTIAAVIAWHLKRQTGEKKKMSIIGIYGNRRNTTYKDSGMIVRDALLGTIKYGDPPYDDLSGNVEVPEAITVFEENYEALASEALTHAFSSIARCDSENDIKYAITNHGPVPFVVKWYNDMKVKDGVLDSETRGESSGAHCMFIYGWTYKDDQLYWLIQNSWGRSWGNNGRAMLPASMPIVEAWDVSDVIIDTEQAYTKPYNSKIGRAFALVINTVINAWNKFWASRKTKED